MTYTPQEDTRSDLLPPLAAGGKSLCSACRKRKLLVRDVNVNGSLYGICRTCEKEIIEPKIKKCLSCESDFMSFFDYRLCSKCKKQSWDNRI